MAQSGPYRVSPHGYEGAEAMAGTVEAMRKLGGSPRVLMYHFFGPVPAGGDPDHQFVSEENFRSQLELLQRGGWRALSLDEYLSWLDGAAAPRRSYLLTIDDAHESVLRIAAPLLAAMGIPAVLFVPTGLMGGTVSWSPDYPAERISSAAALRSLVGTGVELGIHGHDHTRLINMDAAELHHHVAGPRDELAAVTGIRPRAFAYPYGTHDIATRESVAEAGYDVGFAVAREAGRFAKWRIAVDGNDSLRSFRFKLTPAYGMASLAAGRVPGARHKVRAAVAAAKSMAR